MIAAAGDSNACAAALTDAETAALLAPLAGSPVIALAVSGGGDSLALLAAADRWRQGRERPKILVLTVDHGLTPGSDAVAARVAAVASGRGLAAEVLTWTGDKPATGIEAAARQARYRLLVAAAREAGATHLLTAHSLDDQAETFLMRLERGSGVFGLAAMRPAIDLDGLVLFRPFLDVPRARLAATAAAAGLAAHRDPMNDDPRFLRVRLRRALPALAEAGVDAAAIAATAACVAVAADAIDAAADALIAAVVTVDTHAVATLRPEPFAAAPEAVRSRLLVRLLLALGGEDYPPRRDRLAALIAAILDPSAALKRTLAGVVIERRKAGLLLYREAGRDGLPVLDAPPGFTGVWDHRFRIAVPANAPAGLSIAALGASRPERMALPIGVPAAAIATIPAVFAGADLIAVPTLGWQARDKDAVGVSAAEIVSRRLAAPPRFPSFAAG